MVLSQIKSFLISTNLGNILYQTITYKIITPHTMEGKEKPFEANSLNHKMIHNILSLCKQNASNKPQMLLLHHPHCFTVDGQI